MTAGDCGGRGLLCGDDREWRQTVVNRVCIGFELPEIQCPSSGRRVKPAVAFAPAEPVTLAEDDVRYQATDDDLPQELFAAPNEHSEHA